MIGARASIRSSAPRSVSRNARAALRDYAAEALKGETLYNIDPSVFDAH